MAVQLFQKKQSEFTGNDVFRARKNLSTMVNVSLEHMSAIVAMLAMFSPSFSSNLLLFILDTNIDVLSVNPAE